MRISTLVPLLLIGCGEKVEPVECSRVTAPCPAEVCELPSDTGEPTYYLATGRPYNPYMECSEPYCADLLAWMDAGWCP